MKNLRRLLMVLLPAVVAMAVDSCKKLPWEVLVTDITLNTTSIRLEEGETFQLSATVSPDDATNKKVNWQTGNSAIAKVDETGLVSAVGVGKTTVKAKSDDGSITETCDVEVVRKVVSVEKVNLDRDVVDLKIGESVTLVATVSPANADNKAVVWNSSDTKVATVTAGKITGLAVGKTTVTVTTEDGGKTASCEVTVLTDVIAVTGVSLDKTVAEMEVGDELTLTATVTPDDATNKNVIWSSSNTAVATVTDGKVTAVKAGTVIINVSTEDGGKTAGCEITVKDKIIPVTSVSLDKTSLEMVEGGELTLVATVNPDNATDKSVTWTSSDASVASVVNGKVTALKAGTATITVTTNDGGKTASCEVTVKAKLVGVTSVSLDKTTAELTEGDELTLTATVNPDNATDKSVSWTSSDASVASVVNGKVTALKAGTATITVTTTDGGKTAKCEVTVKAKIIPVTSVSLDKTSLEMVEGGELTLVATVNPDNATDKSVSWTSSDASVASVVNGKVTALKAGTATITVTTTDGGKTASCEVTVKAKLVGVTSVSLDKTTAELTEGDELILTATVNPDNATDKSVSWSSSDSSVASVVNGKVTALKAGTATITVTTTDGGKTAKCEVTVKAKLVGVTSVSLDKTTAELTEGDELTLTATVNPDNATDKSVSWSSSDASVASVVNGKVTALKAGTATITVTTTDGGKTAKCEVTVKAKLVGVSSVSLDKTTAELTEGDELILTATVNPDNATDKSVTWSSSDSSVASVVNGKVTALKAGTATITVTTTDGGKTAKCEVTVKAKLVGVTSVSLDKTTAELTEGDELTLTATVNPDNATDKSVSWSSSDASVASVVNGKVTALKAGTATITVTTTDGGKTAKCEVTVKAKLVGVSSVSLDKTTAELTEGDELILTATVNPDNATDKSVTWSSSDSSVASVVNGKVTALKAGTATITVTTTDGGKTASCAVTVKAKVISVTGVTLDKTTAELTEGDELTLTATVNPDNATDKSVTWSSSDASVASVVNGKVTALKAGTATITVTTTDGGKTASCAVTVKAKVISVTGVTLDKTTAELTEGDELTLTATVNPDNATDKSVTWTSSDASVASVVNGKVTALKAGTATITVTTTDGGKTAKCEVTVKAKLVGVTSVSLDKTTAELTEGDELTLTATVNPDNATDKSITWSSSDASVASVVNGKVTALKAGTATITVTTTDGGKTASCAVKVKAKYVAVSSVSLDKTSAELIEGHELTLTATVNPDNATDKSVTWTSSNASVASVVNGKVTAHIVGTATITVTTTDGNMTADCVVTVKEQPIVTLNQSVAEMIVGDEIILGATVSVAGTELIWTSSDATVATVTDGKVKAIKAGVVTITVTTADGGSSASCEITVTEATGNVTGVMIDKSSAILKIGDSITLKAVITPTNADNRNVTWSSTDSSVASVDAGVVTALKVGTATIVVTTEDGNKTAYCKVKVIADEGNEGVGENEGNWE